MSKRSQRKMAEQRASFMGEASTNAAFGAAGWNQKPAWIQAEESKGNARQFEYDALAGGAQTRLGDAYANTQGAMNMARTAAEGNAPSAAAALAQRTTDQGIQNALALSAAGRGGSLAAAQRGAGTAAAGMTQAAVQDAALLRAQEMAQARGEYANLAMGSQQMSQQALQEAEARRIALLQLRQQGELGALGIGADVYSNQYGANMGFAGNQYAADKAFRGQMIGAGIQAGGALVGEIAKGAMMSDERRKRDVADGSSGVAEAFMKLAPKSYRYDEDVGDDDFGSGKRVAGIMAQDLEKSALGRAIIRNTPKGKMVDLRGGLSLALAGVAELFRRQGARSA
jgi:hypothetical protein